MSLLALALSLSALWGDLESGPYRVGFEQVESFDHSRPFRLTEETRARPITMSIWYPAESSESSAAVTFGRYVDGADGREAFTRRLVTYGFSLSMAELEALFFSPTAAREKARRASGRFPLILFGTALTGPFYLNTVLCEYLASHGYVVVAIPSLPARDDVEAGYDLWAIDAQMRDMEFVIQEMHDYPEMAELGERSLGLVAWSLGGAAQAVLSMKNPDVGAVVSLDAATGYAYGEKLLEKSLFFEPSRATASFLHATDSRESAEVPKSFRYFDDIVRGPSFLLTLEGATHAEFTSIGTLVPRSVVSGDEAGAGARRYQILCRY
ncbi:MAG: hypothetical protein ACRD3V_10920, partial [Vicinamibacteria bacterium]